MGRELKSGENVEVLVGEGFYVHMNRDGRVICSDTFYYGGRLNRPDIEMVMGTLMFQRNTPRGYVDMLLDYDLSHKTKYRFPTIEGYVVVRNVKPDSIELVYLHNQEGGLSESHRGVKGD